MGSDIIAEVLSFNKIHHHINPALVLIDFVNGHDIWMAKLHHHSGFTQKRIAGVVVLAIPLTKNFDSLDALITQMDADCAKARSILDAL